MTLLAVYTIAVYLVIPALWRVEIVRHPALSGAPGIIHTAGGVRRRIEEEQARAW